MSLSIVLTSEDYPEPVGYDLGSAADWAAVRKKYRGKFMALDDLLEDGETDSTDLLADQLKLLVKGGGSGPAYELLARLSERLGDGSPVEQARVEE